MGQEVTRPNADRARLSARVGALYASIGRDDRNRCDTLPTPIDLTTRDQLQEYRRQLHAQLQPIELTQAHREQVGKAVGAFLQSYLNAKTNDPGATLRAYMWLLNDQPLFAIIAAVEDFKNGRVFDIDSDGKRIPFTLDYAPSGPRLLDQVKKRAADVQEERHKVTRLLAITHITEPEVSEEERVRVGQLVRQLANSMAMKNERIRAKELENTRAEAQEARERAARIVEEATAKRRAAANHYAE